MKLARLRRMAAELCAMVGEQNGGGSYDIAIKGVTDYRTFVSGINKHNLDSGEDSRVVQRAVQALIRGKILVGHSLQFDLDVLGLSHPREDIRDFSTYEPFKKLNKGNTPALKLLAEYCLGKTIQVGEHNSLEDAKASMQIYLTVVRNWP
ncbi:unnamed protein product, partial [Iphiclides podalirius]